MSAKYTLKKSDIGRYDMIPRHCVAMGLAAMLAACASSPDEIDTAYVSPLKYQKHDCEQVAMEMDHVGRRTSDLYFRLKKKADNDTAQMGIGLILFWPTLFLLEGGDGPDAAEYARLKGEYEALHGAAVQKKCGVAQLPPSPTEIIDERKKKEEAELRELQRQNDAYGL